MTMLPVYKKCKKCGKKYCWNPDVGNMWCPRCGDVSMSGKSDTPKGKSPITILGGALKNRRKDK